MQSSAGRGHTVCRPPRHNIHVSVWFDPVPLPPRIGQPRNIVQPVGDVRTPTGDDARGALEARRLWLWAAVNCTSCAREIAGDAQMNCVIVLCNSPPVEHHPGAALAGDAVPVESFLVCY